jgi:hypothetical protein
LRGSFVLDAAGMITWAVVNGMGEPRDLGDVLTQLTA